MEFQRKIIFFRTYFRDFIDSLPKEVQEKVNVVLFAVSGGCPLSARIRVRFQQELLSVFSKNPCPFCSRICTYPAPMDYSK